MLASTVATRKRPRPFSAWVPQRTRRLHRSIIVMPHLEAELAGMVDLLAKSQLSNEVAALWKYSLVESLATIRTELGRGFRALSEIRRGFDRSQHSEEEINGRLRARLLVAPRGEDLVHRLENAGGVKVVTRRLSLELLHRYNAYGECLRLVRRSDPSDLQAFRQLSYELQTRFPTRPPGPPEVQYGFLCAAGPLGWVATAAIVIGVLILIEDEVDDGDAPGDDDGEPDGSEPEAGICEGELEPDAGVCVPD